MTKILVVDDEQLLVKGLKKSLENEGYETDTAFDGYAAKEKFESGSFDLIILDIMLPGVDGLSLCREFRAVSEVPIIMLTARGEDVDKIIGLELGADDYLAKPFNMRELLARIKAVLRRYKREGDIGKKYMTRGEIKIDPVKRKVFVKHREIELTGKEFELLQKLASSPGRVFTRGQLLEQVWGYNFIGEDRTVDVHIRRLREKVEPDPGKPGYILTKWGVGYYFKDGE